MDHYTTTIKINTSAPTVFKAISTQLGDWWGQQDHPASKEEVIFKVSWGEPWYQFKVIKYNENNEMIWECIDANQIINGLEGVQKEWVGTKIHWRIKPISDDRSQLDFEHQGLIPEFICFEVCTRAWSDFLQQHLVSFLEK